MAVLRMWQALLAIVLSACWLPGWAHGVLPVPALTAALIDQTHTLSVEESRAIEHRLRSIEAKSGSQVVVLMVPTTAPEDIAPFAYRVASTWKIGRKHVGDGLLIVVAKDDRRMRIEVARALEGAIPDLAAARIIDQQMAPQFRQGQYAAGMFFLPLDQQECLDAETTIEAIVQEEGFSLIGWRTVPTNLHACGAGAWASVPSVRQLF